MEILTIIPARSGSKRLPGKNKKILAGKPLIAHTILAAKNSNCCKQIIVSTDSKEIADISLKYGANVPWLRPDNLANDSSDVILSVIDLIERFKKINVKFDSVLLLQPTSPFRKAITIKDAIDLHINTGQSVISVNKSTLKPSWYKNIDNMGNLVKTDIFNDSYINGEFPTTYILNGSIYIASVEQILTNQSFYNEQTKAFIIDNLNECLDIDTLADWALAEKLIELKIEVL